MVRMNFYELMEIFDELCVNYADNDFRDWEVRCNRILDQDIIYIHDLKTDKNICTIVLNK